MEHKVEKKWRTLQERDELISLWKQSSKSRKLFCDRQGLNYNSFIIKYKQHKAKAKTETGFSGKLKKRYDGSQILTTITQDWKSCAADLELAD